MALIEKHPSIDYRATYGIELEALAEVLRSLAEVLVGRPERGIKRIRRAIECTRSSKDQYGHCLRLVWSSYISWSLRDFAAMRAPLEICVARAAEYGFQQVVGWACGMLAALKAAEGNSATALTEWKAAEAGLEPIGSFLWARGFANMATEIYRKAINGTETLRFIDSCLDQLNQSSAHVPEAELCRIKGEIIGAAPPFNLAESEYWLRRAIETSQRQGSQWYELRATVSLARLLIKRVNRAEARTMLTEIYNRFTEGFDTTDLKEAKTLLDELAG
jgi:hypothetical protein